MGRITAKKLRLFGIEYGYQLREKSEEYLEKHFGKFGRHLYRIIRGIDNRPILTNWERKSVGIENTFPKDFEYDDKLFIELNKLVSGLYKRLEISEKQGKTLTLKVKFSDFQQITRSITTDEPVLSKSKIMNLAHQKLTEVSQSQYKNEKVRLLGVSISNLVNEKAIKHQGKQLDSHLLKVKEKTT